MRQFLERMCRPEWNRRILTQADFERFCLEDKILVREAAIEARGAYVAVDGLRVIFLSSRIVGVEKLIIEFHELGHAWLHVPNLKLYRGMFHRIQQQANIVSACALVPSYLLDEMSEQEICESFGYPQDLVRFRFLVRQFLGL